jgi:hypothetical protein
LHHERCIDLRLKYLPAVHADLMNSWCLLATESLKVGLNDSAIQQFNKAYQISRELKGEDHEQTASYLINIANAFS